MEDILRLSTVELTWDAVNKLCQTEAKRVRFAEESQDDSDGDSGNGTPFSRIIAFESDEDSDEDSENGEKEEEEEEGLPKRKLSPTLLEAPSPKRASSIHRSSLPASAGEDIGSGGKRKQEQNQESCNHDAKRRRDDENIDAQELWRECYISKSRLSLRRLLTI